MNRIVTAFAVLACTALSIEPGHAQTTALPAFTVDPAWPRALPNNWSVGPVSAIVIDSRNHVWIVQRAEAAKQACGTPGLAGGADQLPLVAHLRIG